MLCIDWTTWGQGRYLKNAQKYFPEEHTIIQYNTVLLYNLSVLVYIIYADITAEHLKYVFNTTLVSKVQVEEIVLIKYDIFH